MNSGLVCTMNSNLMVLLGHRAEVGALDEESQMVRDILWKFLDIRGTISPLIPTDETFLPELEKNSIEISFLSNLVSDEVLIGISDLVISVLNTSNDETSLELAIMALGGVLQIGCLKQGAIPSDEHHMKLMQALNGFTLRIADIPDILGFQAQVSLLRTSVLELNYLSLLQRNWPRISQGLDQIDVNIMPVAEL